MARGPLAGGLRSRWVALDCRVSAYACPRGRRLGPVAGAKPTMSASRGPSSAMAVAGRSHSPLRAVVATACWTATLSKLHQRRRQPLAALARTAGGARGARVRTKRRRSASQSRCQRPPTSQASTRRRCGPGPRSSGYRSSLRRRAASRAAPSVRWDWCAGMACRVSGLTRVASQHSASPWGVAPCTTMSRRRWSSDGTAAGVAARACCGMTRPSGPTASRATRTQARSTMPARRPSAPLRGHASAWSPRESRAAPQPGARLPAPHRCRAKGKGSRRRRRSAVCICSGRRVSPGSLGMAVSQAPACGPACERRRACSGAAREGSRVCSR